MRVYYIFLALFTTFFLVSCSRQEEHVKMAIFLKSDWDKYEVFAKEFEKAKGIKIQLDYIWDDTIKHDYKHLWSKIHSAIEKKLKDQEIDLIAGVPTPYFEKLIKKNLLTELDTFMVGQSGIDVKNLYSPVLDIAKKAGNGHYYFLSPTFSTKLLVVNLDIFKTLKVPIPEETVSWEELESIAEKINRKNLNPHNRKIYAISFGPGGEEGLFMDFQLLTTPLELPLQEKEEIYNHPSWGKWFKWFITMHQKYGVRNMAEDRAFFTGKVAMRITYPHELQWLYKKARTDLGLGFNPAKFEFRIYPVPYYSNKPEMASIEVHNIALSNQSEKKHLAWEVIRYAMGKDYALSIIYKEGNTFGGNFPAYYDSDTIRAYENLYPGIDVKNVFYYGKQGPYIKESMTLEQLSIFHELEREYFPIILNKNISVEDGYKELKREYKQRIKELKQ
ncbi:MAG: ABC transporter substrate-binding protein [Anoxybacillus gonensis]|nr:ABC transporter substrate-binding protein [Anoxybacillus gonensis]